MGQEVGRGACVGLPPLPCVGVCMCTTGWVSPYPEGTFMPPSLLPYMTIN